MTTRQQRIENLHKELKQRILILDGAMGTMIQSYKLDEADYRGSRFADHSCDLKGNNELLSLTQPQIIRDIHKAYFDAGADMVETNTFGANGISQADYEMPELAYEMNLESTRLARAAADAAEAETPGRTCYVVGILGPTTRAASISPDVNDPGYRSVTYDELRAAYAINAKGCLDGGADTLMIETSFDTLNAKAAISAIFDTFDETGEEVPIQISGTIPDFSGRTLSGQTPEAFWYSVRHARPLTVGLNCALGAKEMRPHIEELSNVAECYISAHPNAGLPNEFGGYDETPEMMATEIQEFAKANFLNIAGGCCGTAPEHIRAFAECLKEVAPRVPPERERRLRLSGLEPFIAAE